jgi:hypothetical protein
MLATCNIYIATAPPGITSIHPPYWHILRGVVAQTLSNVGKGSIRIPCAHHSHFTAIYEPQHTAHNLRQTLHRRIRTCLRHQRRALRVWAIRRRYLLSVLIFSQKILFYKPVSIDSKCNETGRKVMLKKWICGKKSNVPTKWLGVESRNFTKSASRKGGSP